MKGYEDDRHFPIVSRVNGGKEVMVAGFSYYEEGANNRAPYELNIDMLISEPGSIDFDSLLSGRWNWDTNMYNGRGISNLNWVIHQLIDIMKWAGSVGFRVMTFCGSDLKRHRVFSKILKRHLKKYNAEDLMGVELIEDDDEDGHYETFVKIPDKERLNTMRAVCAWNKFETLKGRR